jgi:predicted AlkP superfamily pyrophosphatase or phosphodiesterase
MKILIQIFLILGIASCQSKGLIDSDPGLSAGESEVKLILILVVDQLRGDYLDRFGPVLEGGLSWLTKNAIWFEDAHQDHGITSTGPGHASISTGTYPSRSGIISNQWFDKRTGIIEYCVSDENSPLIGVSPGIGRSPVNLEVTAFPDWLKDKWPSSKAFTASYKDRAAILLGGERAKGAYWYSPSNGSFVTSTYYQENYPNWVEDFAARRLPDQFFGKLWEALAVPERTKETLQIKDSDRGWYETAFPHAIGGFSSILDESFYAGFAATPLIDWYLVEFAKKLIEEESLGRGVAPDYLGLSFSALDLVGHQFGPNSPEVLDTIMRLDVSIQELLDFIDQAIGLERVVIVLTGDHGVAQLPEIVSAGGGQGRRVNAQDQVCIQNSNSRISKRLGYAGEWFSRDYYLNDVMIRNTGLSSEEVNRVAAEILGECDFLTRVWTREELLQDGTDPWQRVFSNSFHKERSPDLIPQLKENYIISSGLGTAHGSPYRYDSHVPVLSVVPGVRAMRVKERIPTIDIAPTLADLVRVEIPPHVQGKSLIEFFESQGSLASGDSVREESLRIIPGRSETGQ